MPPSTLYPLPVASEVRVLVSDLYLAAYLLEKGQRLHALRFDTSSRATFILTGHNALHHRRAFATGDVCVHLPSFRHRLNTLRDLVLSLQRNHPKDITLPAPPLAA